MLDYIRISCVFAAGIYLSERISPSFSLIFLAALILVLTIKGIFKHTFNIRILFMCSVFVLGVCLCSAAQNTENLKLNDYTARYVTVTGRVCELPSSNNDGNIRYIIDAREVTFKGEKYKIKEKLILTSPDDYEYGDTVTFAGFPAEIEGKMNEKGYDYARYYASKKVFFKMYSEKTSLADYKIKNYSPASIALYVKAFAQSAIDKRYKGDMAAVLKAVLANNKKEFSPEFRAVLNRTGLDRFYYPAYLHVMLYMALITFCLGFLKRKNRDIGLIIFLIIYALFNSSSSTFVKMSLILAVIIFYRRFHGYVYYLDIIGAVAIIMGIINPLVFYDLGFIFSMLSSVLIFYFYESVEKHFKFIPIKYVRRCVVIGLICSLGLLPVTAFFLNGVSLHSVLVSFLMLPFVAIILISSVIGVPLLALFGTAPLFGWAMSGAAYVLYIIPTLADKLPFLALAVHRTDILDLLIYFFVLVGLNKGIKKKKRDMYIALMTAAALCFSVMIDECTRLNDVEFTFVNVGQGDGAIISAPHRFNILIDGGGGNEYSDYNPGEAIYLEYLKTENMQRIDSTYVSHYHKDHVQGIIAAVENLNVRNLFMPDTMRGSEWRTELERAAYQKGTKIHYLTEEAIVRYNNGMVIHAVPPTENTIAGGDENDTSWLYYVTYGGFSAAYTGDMTEYGEKNLLAGGRVPSVDLLKVGHHGSGKSTSKEWAKTLNPMYSIISVGEDNTYNMPAKEVLSNLSDSLVYRTDMDGDIRFIVNKKGIKNIETFRGKR